MLFFLLLVSKCFAIIIEQNKTRGIPMKTLSIQDLIGNPVPKSASGLYCPVCGQEAFEHDGKMVCEDVHLVKIGISDIQYCDFEETDELKAVSAKVVAENRLEQVNALYSKLSEVKDNLEGALVDDTPVAVGALGAKD